MSGTWKGEGRWIAGHGRFYRCMTKEERHPFVGAWAFLSPSLARSLKWLPNKSLGIFFLSDASLRLEKLCCLLLNPKEDWSNFMVRALGAFRNLQRALPRLAELLLPRWEQLCPVMQQEHSRVLVDKRSRRDYVSSWASLQGTMCYPGPGRREVPWALE